MDTPIGAKIDFVISTGLAPLMKAHKFSKTGRTFYRRCSDDDWQVLNVQASTGNAGDAGKFTINVGVYLGAVAVLAGQSLSTKPKEYDCTIRERVGALMPGGADHWWTIDPSTDLTSLSRETADCVGTLCIPWMESHSDVRRVCDALAHQPSVMAASAALAAGERDEAARRIARMIADRPMAAGTARAWAKRHGISFDVT